MTFPLHQQDTKCYRKAYLSCFDCSKTLGRNIVNRHKKKEFIYKINIGKQLHHVVMITGDHYNWRRI